MVFTLLLFSKNGPTSCPIIKWECSGDDGTASSGVAERASSEPAIIEAKCDCPGFVHLIAVACDKDGNPLLNTDVFHGGAGADLNKIFCATEIPNDFDDFWKQRTNELDAASLNIIDQVAITDTSYSDFNVYDMKIGCPGGMPISGYLSIPKGAKPKSLAGAVHFAGYGVDSAPMPCNKDTISFGINAHGISNGLKPEYYSNLKSTKYAEYGFSDTENGSPETVYFKGMILRALGALRFVKSLTEWNGRDLIVAGGSQGALQAVFAAAYDKDVTFCDIFIPWLCDIGGKNIGRIPGWHPEFANGLRYYDTAIGATRVTCPVKIVAGLGDYVCPPSSVVALYNNLPGQKSLAFIQGKTHAYDPPLIDKNFFENDTAY